ncbi:MAG: hypothetical protein EBY96_06515 [Actinobacteria bacterium]|nr:hypothetical protein [Actinomycetota bacterium]
MTDEHGVAALCVQLAPCLVGDRDAGQVDRAVEGEGTIGGKVRETTRTSGLRGIPRAGRLIVVSGH